MEAFVNNEQSEIVRRNLRHDLTPDEINALGRQAAKAAADADEREERRKEVDAQFKAEIKSLHATASIAHRKINNGYEYRDVECSRVQDFTHNRVIVTRLDTSEVVEDRAMSGQERQGDLLAESGDAGEEPAKATANGRRGRGKKGGDRASATAGDGWINCTSCGADSEGTAAGDPCGNCGSMATVLGAKNRSDLA